LKRSWRSQAAREVTISLTTFVAPGVVAMTPLQALIDYAILHRISGETSAAFGYGRRVSIVTECGYAVEVTSPA
jgi:hypothetical protein